MAHKNILDKATTALLVVDLQEAFRSPINDFAQIAARTSIAVRGFQILGLPVFVVEQYPKGLGRTAEEILLSLPPETEIIEKTAFSACGAELFLEKLRASGATQIVLCGLETHICVNQTAHDLLNEGFQVHVLSDCVGSRFTTEHKEALKKMHMHGAQPATVEMTLFELLRDAKDEHFTEIQSLIK